MTTRLDATTTTTAAPVPAGTEPTGWLTVCPVDRLQPGRGAAALVGDTQVALFRLADGSVYALGNIDPFTGAAVVSRGIVGDRGGEPTIASPLHKQVFALRDGRCLDGADDGDAVSLPAFAVRVMGDALQVGLR
ncbi:nitrite reductase small subunit NirD [Pseudonocardia alni]|jgi:nitrite reductase (NADH) small subunit|uniref:Nitrite reductase (NADH) small subunit n=1 Tax=Pseudonocardia alni TaxID=33907 RepID=A0A852VZY7_PSEA5|nr:nitrite reductase small subunit NirD [Pseudonocardia antarctica]NYG01829.1 nitrite reductase (NADH) small subunit [Pseudonocardia antarctica]OJG03651.1 Nitrite reductase (NADH) small subunit [Pseudonocardia autotrophica]